MMISEEHQKIISIAGFVYWKDFFQDRRGNPWSVRPTRIMVENYQVFYMSKKNATTHERETAEVFFDKHYVREWVNQTFEGIEFLLPQENSNTDIQDRFSEFEAINGIVLSGKNPRHSLYSKFKEFIHAS